MRLMPAKPTLAQFLQVNLEGSSAQSYDSAFEYIELAAVQDMADTMQHKPRRLLGYVKGFG